MHNPSQNTADSALQAKAALPKRVRASIDFAELRRQISIAQVLDILTWRPVARHGAQLRGPCPVHKSQDLTSRSFSVNIAKNVFRCFGGGCGVSGNQLDLWTAITGLPIYEAALDLCERLGIDPPTQDSSL